MALRHHRATSPGRDRRQPQVGIQRYGVEPATHLQHRRELVAQVGDQTDDREASSYLKAGKGQRIDTGRDSEEDLRLS